MSRLIGHDAQLRQFEQACASGRLHHGWILSGPRGVGKARFALAAARMLVDPENRHSDWIEHRTHPDIVWVERLAKDSDVENSELARSLGVDQVRGLQQKLTMQPSMGPKRAVIIDSADDFERSAANALLKSLEEPPVGTIFLLVSHSSERLLPTIRSRCQMLRFNPLSPQQMTAILAEEAPELAGNALERLIASSNGSPGQAIAHAALDLAAVEASMDLIIDRAQPGHAETHKLADALSAKSAQMRYEAFLRRVPSKIAEFSRSQPLPVAAAGAEAYHAAETLAARALALSLDKPAVVMQMGNLLASLRANAADA
ncbi:DNA polymerase III subunit delta' [Sphingorhabdus sp.]|uniref:DNA polymerase III subunit delta' n=1 Tax=Sphingorhabdus sp. TaxID=1902408 RepID=UPI003BB0FD17